MRRGGANKFTYSVKYMKANYIKILIPGTIRKLLLIARVCFCEMINAAFGSLKRQEDGRRCWP